MAFVIEESKIIEWANSINVTYLGRLFDKIKKHTYVRIICKKHDYKGEQIIGVDRLQRWSESGKCMCDCWNRDTEDLRRDPNLNSNVEIVGEYIKSNIKIECRCKKCGNKWKATPNKLQQGEGCPLCRGKTISEKNRFPFEMVKELLNKKQPDIELIGEYKNMRTKIHYKCKVCGYEGYSYPCNLLNLSASCKRCKSTVGERKIAEWLDENGYTYKMQFIFRDCKDKQPLRFDFYIPSINTCIEYQGEQHYMPVRFRKDQYNMAETAFVEQKRRDNIKREYCNSNHIQLIEVPYWESKHIGDFLKTCICSE